MGEAKSVRHVLRWQLVAYGVSHDDPRIDRMTLDDLVDWVRQERAAFQRTEQTWWDGSLSLAEKTIMAESIQRYALGGVPSYPFVQRPFDYGVFGHYTEVGLDTARRLLDRGLAVVRDAESRHHIVLSALERESAFDLAEDPVAEVRLMEFRRQLRTNRPEADRLTLAHWGELPPSRGEQYDTAAFDLAGRRIAHAYQRRDTDPTAIYRAIRACRIMIGRSPEFINLFHDLEKPLPAHKGFEQLAIILDKRGEYAGAIQTCERARDEGWKGDWEKRIARYRKRLV